MRRPPSRDTPDGRAYLELRARARKTGRPTAELIHLYALEGLLARIAASPRHDDLVLKGGMLLAAYDVRRPTRDLDLLARRTPNELETVRDLVVNIASLDLEDGLTFVTEEARASTIREGGSYSGVRVSLKARLSTAKLNLHVDVNVGDPVEPPPTTVLLPRLLVAEPLAVRGYPLTMVLAEKLTTAVELGPVNTRWRDFADIYLLASTHRVDGSALLRSLRSVADFRGIAVRPLHGLTALVSAAQPRWTVWRRRQSLEQLLPANFGDVFEAVVAFADPVLEARTAGSRWNPQQASWESAT